MKSKTGTLLITLFLFSIFVYSPLLSQVSIPQPRLTGSAGKAYVNISIKYSVHPVFVQTSLNRYAAITSDTTRKKDRDGDGISDSLDKCPDEKGVIQYDGCPIPDSDNDGIPDDRDGCPTIAGSAKYKGCPPPDQDGDKINDEEDQCPTQPGVARYNGCPVGDRDHDGVNDDDDKCINVPGTTANQGCPESKKNTITLRGKGKK